MKRNLIISNRIFSSPVGAELGSTYTADQLVISSFVYFRCIFYWHISFTVFEAVLTRFELGPKCVLDLLYNKNDLGEPSKLKIENIMILDQFVQAPTYPYLIVTNNLVTIV